MNTIGRVLLGPDTQDFDEDATTNVIGPRSVMLAVPPSAIVHCALIRLQLNLIMTCGK